MTFRLHHLGCLVADLETAARDFENRLGYRRESEIIHDPVQTAQVLFLRQPGVFSWLELVTPDGPTSKLANALRKGGGWHHSCHETDDLAAACAQLRGNGMFPLGDPAPAAAFPGRRIAWFMDAHGLLVELLEAGDGMLSLASLEKMARES